MLHPNFTAESAQENNHEVSCPHCKKTGNKPIMRRWHFDFCQSNPNRRERKKKVKEIEVKEFDPTSDPLFTKAFRTEVFLTDAEVIRAKQLFDRLPEHQRPMLFRIARYKGDSTLTKDPVHRSD